MSIWKGFLNTFEICSLQQITKKKKLSEKKGETFKINKILQKSKKFRKKKKKYLLRCLFNSYKRDLRNRFLFRFYK